MYVYSVCVHVCKACMYVRVCVYVCMNAYVSVCLRVHMCFYVGAEIPCVHLELVDGVGNNLRMKLLIMECKGIKSKLNSTLFIRLLCNHTHCVSLD